MDNLIMDMVLIGGSNNHYDGKYQLGKLDKMDAAMILGEA